MAQSAQPRTKPPGKLGLGWATIQAAMPGSAALPVEATKSRSHAGSGVTRLTETGMVVVPVACTTRRSRPGVVVVTMSVAVFAPTGEFKGWYANVDWPAVRRRGQRRSRASGKYQMRRCSPRGVIPA